MKSSVTFFVILCLLASGWASDYQIALPGYHFQFPRDHFNHPEYQTEWWYYTGNLKASDGHRFGFELTFFRQAVTRDKDSSTWQIRDLFMAHLALTDITGNRFYHTERLNRAGPGMAGVDEKAHTIWNGNWQVQLDDKQHLLQAVDQNFNIALTLKPAKPPVIQGRDGVSQKAEGKGHASHYISFTRLLTTGAIGLNGKSYQVEGASWMDHEFFTNSMDRNESGWDWLSLQLDDNTELMLYRLRHKDGSVDPYSSGTVVDASGQSSFLSSRDFTMTPGAETWTSPATKATYPTHWQVSVPSLLMQLNVTTPLAAQELSSGIGPSYWEGSIDISGERASSPIHGFGYLEMTGYDSTPPLGPVK